jgi:DNA invertase Pin-like site-specific DNA recombinase
MSGHRNRAARLEILADGTVYVLRYLRVSSDEQKDKGLSIPFQDDETTRYMLARSDDGWIEDGRYEDVLSGKRPERIDYQRLLARARELRHQGKRVVVVVFKTDRFGRRLSERIRAWEELKELQIELHAVYEGGKQDRLSHNVRALLSEEEVEGLSERVSAARSYVVSRGWRAVGRAPWGYRWRDATDDERGQGSPRRVLEEHPDEAPHVREMWRRRAIDGDSIHAIGLYLATLPDGARGGRTLDYSMARVMLSSPVYVGRPDRGADDVLARPVGKWPALVDPSIWIAVRERDAQATRQPAQATGRYLLTGLLRCWRCGHRMDGRSFLPKASRKRGTERRRRTYRCISRMRGASGASAACLTEAPLSAIEPLVVERVGRLLDALSQPDTLAQIEAVERDQAERNAADGESRSARIGVETARITRARKLLAAAGEAKLIGELGQDDYAIIRDKQLDDLRAAETAIAELRGRSTASAPAPLSSLIERIPGWAEALETTDDVAAARVALGQLVEMIVPMPVGGKWSRAWKVELIWTPAGAVLRDAVEALEKYPVGAFGKTNTPTGYSLPA